MWKVARRPRWIAALILALAVAAGFALLSQWQLARSVSTGTVVDRSTETTLPLETVARPQSPVTTASDGQLVTVSGSFVAGDYLVLSKRLNGGVDGFWVVGHFRTEDGAGVAVALGWTASKAEATSAADGLSDEAVEVSGRYVADEAPQETDFEHGEFSTLSMAALVNLWPDADPAGVYGGYIVSSAPVAGLTAIDSPRPVVEVELNWLNLFYAAEWVIFAGFAIFLWWRLVKDAWERTLEPEEEAISGPLGDASAEARPGPRADI
ncbi:MAG TPA: SURF1 family cytochrome oxidase biogenesis protein [Terrimesophilobacter sp.]|uniref:SURF1 family protein n=1 Tax=Terrimesophilobacter sp. TaxID=2906435 RepID=UPI002F93FC7F